MHYNKAGIVFILAILVIAFSVAGFEEYEKNTNEITETVTTHTENFEEETNEEATKQSRMVYITLHGTKYHYSADCVNSKTIAISEETAMEIYEPCQKCT